MNGKLIIIRRRRKNKRPNEEPAIKEQEKEGKKCKSDFMSKKPSHLKLQVKPSFNRILLYDEVEVISEREKYLEEK